MINKVETNSVEEISEIVFKKKAMSQVIKSENEKEKKIQNDLNCMFCFIKDKLFDIMSEVNFEQKSLSYKASLHISIQSTKKTPTNDFFFSSIRSTHKFLL